MVLWDRWHDTHRQNIKAWKWMVASGVASLLFAVLIVIGWPETTGIVIGLLVKINFLTSGFSLFMLAIAIRNHGV